MPVINRNTGTQIELPSATAARSRGLTRPAITASTKPMAVCASWAVMIGRARPSRLRSSRRTRAGRLRGGVAGVAVRLFTDDVSRYDAKNRRFYLLTQESGNRRL